MNVSRTVVISVFHSFVTRNLLYGSALKKLEMAGLHIVLLVPAEKYSHFRDLFKEQGIEIVSVDNTRLTSLPRNTFLQRLSFLLIRSHYLWYKQVERRDERPGIRATLKYVFEHAFVRMFANRPLPRFIYRKLYRWYADTSLVEDVIRQFQPAFFVSTDVFDLTDRVCLLAAARLGIKTIGMVRSWDNCYSKGLLPIIPDHLLVNTHYLKEEAVQLHDVPAEHIEVIGLPQMDSFLSLPTMDRTAFMHSVGADPKEKLIVFAPGGSILTDIDWQICEILREAIQSGKIRYPAHVLVRNHPHHPADLSRFNTDKHFTIEHPGRVLSTNSKETELLPGDQEHLYQTLAAADVVLWVATTLGIDTAMLDRPQIMVNFDGFEQREYLKSVRKFHDEDHMKKFVATSGAHVARTKEDLVEWINRYLDDPSLDHVGRQRIVETQIIFTDGKSGERFADAILHAIVSTRV